jgi:hypothetical protein
MTDATDVQVQTSSNDATAENLKNDDPTQAWTSVASDQTPIITITVAQTDSLIEKVTLKSTTNVASYTVEVVDETGSTVSIVLLL